MKRVIFNQKGGVGKSSITANLAAISAYHGLKTLVVDLDAQCNCSQYILGQDVHLTPNQHDIGEFFQNTLSFKIRAPKPSHYVRSTPYENLFIIPSSSELGTLQPQLEAKHKIYKLRDFLKSFDHFDAIYIDTPPAYNFFTISALIAANSCLIPFDCDEFARKALFTLMENINEITEDHNATLQIEGIIVNQFQPRATIPKKLIDGLKMDGNPVLQSMIRSSVKMKESHEAGIPLIHLDQKHALTKEFTQLFLELHPEVSTQINNRKKEQMNTIA